MWLPCQSLSSPAVVLCAASIAYGIDWVYSINGRQRMKLDQVVFLDSIAELMIELLEIQPVWETTPLLPFSEKIINSSMSDSQPNAAGLLPSWPTPSAEAWHDVQEKVALRVLTTLDWLHGRVQRNQQQHDSFYRNACSRLKEQLAFLLNRLLLGHLLDPSLNMKRIIRLGIASLLHMLDSIVLDYRP